MGVADGNKARTGNSFTPNIYISPSEGAPQKLVDVMCIYGGAGYIRYHTTSCGVVSGQETRGTNEYAQRARNFDCQCNNTPAGPGGKVQKCLEEFGKVLFAVAATVERNQQGLPRPHQVCGGGHRQDPVPDHDAPSQVPCGAYWSHLQGGHLKQRVGMQLFRTGIAFKFDKLYVCLGFSHSTIPHRVSHMPKASASFATGQRIPPPNRSCIAGGRFTGTPF